MQEHTSYIMLRPDETRGMGDGPSSHIPSLGAATSGIDQYRTIGINSTNLPELGAAFTDITAVAAISRLAEGGISSYADLEAAETALQALLLHDIVHIIVHAPKVDYGNGLITYRRFDNGMRSQFGFDLFRQAQSRDFLIAPEFLRKQGEVIVDATFKDSPLLGRSLDTISVPSDYWNETIADAVNASIGGHGIPAYLTDPLLIRTRRGDGFAKRFYHRLRISWDKHTGDVPPMVCTFSVPPLLAIVMDRMSNRNVVPEVVSELRDELRDVRRELREFNEIVTSSTSSAEIEARTKHISESFDAIVPESRMSRAHRFQRRISIIQGLVRPIIKFMAGFVMQTGMPYDKIHADAQGIPNLITEGRAITDRTITAKTFAGLVGTEAIQSLVKTHLTESEIRAIEASMQSR